MSVSSALVVGGGITGSVLAVALAGRGVRVDLAEISPVWHGVGHGITVQGNALAALAKVGVLDEVLKRGVPFDQLRMRQADGSLIAEVPTPRTGGPVKPLVEIEPAEWDEVFGANVRSIYLMCRAFLPAMYRRGSGDVINIASVTGKRPLTRRTPYAASKTAVLGLTRTLAFEAGPLGVRVNSLSPGPCRGERMTRNFTAEAAASGSSYAQAEEAFVSRAALRRLVEEDEVAAAVLAMLRMPGLCGADIDLSAGMIAPS